MSRLNAQTDAAKEDGLAASQNLTAMNLQPGKRYTWIDLPDFDGEQRWELIDGHPYAMSSPLTAHQLVSVRLTGALLPAFNGKPCQLLVAPMDVKLTDHDVVQPDLLVVCEPAQMLRTHVEGPPRLIIEILSDSTVRHDRVRKLNLYARAGVAEYWLVTPHPAMIEVLHNDNFSFRVAGSYTERDPLHSVVFPHLKFDLGPIFADLPDQPLIDEVHEASPEYLATLMLRRGNNIHRSHPAAGRDSSTIPPSQSGHGLTGAPTCVTG
ncbi:Uma2 family endonuclease [bacterium]|nr:Uma2 family endonuclease [bacterium]